MPDKASSLPIVESCEGCGACCMEQMSPPGYVDYLVTFKGSAENRAYEDGIRAESLPSSRRSPATISSTAYAKQCGRPLRQQSSRMML